MVMWWIAAAVAAVVLLPASLESLEVALVGLAEELRLALPPSSDMLKLVGGATVLVVLWSWTTPKSQGRRGAYRSPYRRR